MLEGEKLEMGKKNKVFYMQLIMGIIAVLMGIATFIYGVFVFRNPDVGSSFICLVLLFCCMIVCGSCTAITIANYIKNNKEKR